MAEKTGALTPEELAAYLKGGMDDDMVDVPHKSDKSNGAVKAVARRDAVSGSSDEFLKKVEAALAPFGVSLLKGNKENWTSQLPIPKTPEALQAVWAVIQDGPIECYSYWDAIRVEVECNEAVEIYH